MDEKEERLDAERREERAPRVLKKATKEQPWQNSLGMKFVPVAGTQVLFNIWDTRLEDFHAFVESAGYDATESMYSIGKDGWKRRGATWKEPGFKQGPTYPVVGVSWDDVKAFCEWLTKRERGSGALPESMHYRLPTDTEWSVAVGLDSEPGNTPEEKSSKINLYPWGTKWPPPSGSGNYCGEEARIRNEPEGWPVIQGYSDGYPRTSPVGSFAANKNGLYTQEQVREVIDMLPIAECGWSQSSICRDIRVRGWWGIRSWRARPGRMSWRCVGACSIRRWTRRARRRIEFLDGFIGEMAALFPDEYFHIGGDENNGKQWKDNPQIQEFMRRTWLSHDGATANVL